MIEGSGGKKGEGVTMIQFSYIKLFASIENCAIPDHVYIPNPIQSNTK